MKPEKPVILFDLDGTLVDSEALALRTVQICFAEWGHNVESAEAEKIRGKRWDTSFDYLIERFPISVSREEVVEKVFRTYHSLVEQELIPVDGVPDVIYELSKKFRLGIVTGSGHQQVNKVLGRLEIEGQFEKIVGAEDYQRGKPDPECYLLAMREMGVTPENTVVFEDSDVGLKAAWDAGARVVFVTQTRDRAACQAPHLRYHEQIRDFRKVDSSWISSFLSGQ